MILHFRLLIRKKNRPIPEEMFQCLTYSKSALISMIVPFFLYNRKSICPTYRKLYSSSVRPMLQKVYKMKRVIALITVLFLICVPLGSYLMNTNRETDCSVRTSDSAYANDSHTARSGSSREEVWDIQRLGHYNNSGNCTSLTLDSNNHPHVGSYGGYNYSMGYFYYDGNQWRERYYYLSLACRNFQDYNS